MRRLALALACVMPAFASAQTSRAAAPLDLGFTDAVFGRAPADRDPWLQRIVAARADIVRIDVGWAVADTVERPAGFDARNPADAAYDFTRADAAIRAATDRGLRVLASFSGAPRWAEGAGRPPAAPPGSWRPDPHALEDYGAALALRYSGRFPDPTEPGRMLPRVSAFQLWNEPNLGKYLSPQWSGAHTEAPALYRGMVNAFYRGVKSASDALVVTAGTAPFGDPEPGGPRIMPARFVRDMLCLQEVAGRLRGTGCADPAHFDVLSHHPYSVGTPERSALNADDVSIPDLGKLTRLLRAAERTGGVLPRARHRLWVTEVSYDSSPPDPQGVPIATHARFLELALYELWRQGVDTIFWFQIADQPPDPSYAATNQSGVYFIDGRPKPALQAFRFPFVARAAGRTVMLWGRPPASGTLAIEHRVGQGWRTVQTLHATAGRPFLTHLLRQRPMSLRASAGPDVSLTWNIP